MRSKASRNSTRIPTVSTHFVRGHLRIEADVNATALFGKSATRCLPGVESVVAQPVCGPAVVVRGIDGATLSNDRRDAGFLLSPGRQRERVPAIQRHGNPAACDVLCNHRGRGRPASIATRDFDTGVVCANLVWPALGGLGPEVSRFAELLVMVPSLTLLHFPRPSRIRPLPLW